MHGVKDVTWIRSDGEEAEQHDWTDNSMKCVGMLMDGRAQVNSVPQEGDHSTLMLILNMARDNIAFSMPEAVDGVNWTRLIDTSDAKRGEKLFEIGEMVPVATRSLVLMRLNTHHPAPVPDINASDKDRE